MRIIGHIGLEEKLFTIKQRGALNRTFLFLGGKDSGKTFIGTYFAAMLIGDSVWRKANPDFFYFRGSQGKYAETLDAFMEACQKKPFQNSRVVVFFDDIDQIPIAATNTLLKTLEEPPEKTTIIISAQSQETLLDTIISRSFRFNLAPRTRIDKQEILFEHGIQDFAYRLSISDDLKICMSKDFKQLEDRTSECMKLFEHAKTCKDKDLASSLQSILDKTDLVFFFNSIKNLSSSLEFQKLVLSGLDACYKYNNKFLTLFTFISKCRNNGLKTTS